MIQEIAKRILAIPGHAWVLQMNFFAGALPQKTKTGQPVPSRVMVLLERVPADLVADLPDYMDYSLQVWNRGADYFQARTDAYLIFEALHGDWWRDLPIIFAGKEYRAWTTDAKGSPTPIAAPNDNGLFEFSTNYLLRIANLAA